MNRRRRSRPVPSEAGSTFLAAIMLIATLSAVAGAFVMAVTSRTKTAFESASWRQASLAAESGANLAMAEIRRVLPDLNRPVTGAWSGWTSSSGVLPAGCTIPAGVTLTLEPPPLVHAGEGNTVMTARVTLDAPAGMVDSAGKQWLRLRSRGTAFVPGMRRVSPDKMDNRLRRLSLVRDAALGEFTSRPQVTRTIEMIVQPVRPFRGAIATEGAINVEGSRSRVDSFDSRDPQASTSGDYDTAKRRSSGGVHTNDNRFNFAGEIRGDVATNNANVQPSERITGTVDNNSFRPLPTIGPGDSSIATTNTLEIAAAGGTDASPGRYKIAGFTGNLRVTGSSPSVVEVYVDGNVNGVITVDQNVQLRLYVDGNINLLDIRNASRRAGNLIIYGLPSSTGATRTFNLALLRDIHCAVYAPAHAMRVAGDNDLMGSLTVRSLDAAGSPRFHFDEALTLGAGRIIDYRIASWVEEVL